MSSRKDELLTASAEGDLSRLQELSPTSDDDQWEAMMMNAAEKGHAHVVRYLLERGAPVSGKVIEEATEHPEVFKALVLSGGLDVNHDFEIAGDMLINAVWEGKNGADPNSGHLMGDSTSAITTAAEREFLDLAELLVEHGAKVSGTGALPGAAAKGHLEMVQYLLDQGANIDEIGVHDYGDRRKKKYKGMALHQAAAEGHLETLQLLLDRGAKADLVDPMNRTPLARAREENQQQAVELLNSRGVNS